MNPEEHPETAHMSAAEGARDKSSMLGLKTGNLRRGGKKSALIGVKE